ncbi:hypothetical protein HXX76_005947 [Chlamydomonas incerta]|uniref:Uncharacterized protein n=1 Tax=Chlamydomonas incerta TaxID=51695 RepID=A0A835T1U6_CHLIN|nr:hypothetical protein HXX76_005947 [Chlamydomonas incerta]|eukprot:KAG2437289.1 hypothetical protein HXX76_005947 [Chlamydomonas incerta]
MAALLGLALGVMACVSIVELVVRNAMSGESDPLLILAAAGAGALTYYVAEPFFPKMDEGHDHLVKKQDDVDDHEAYFRHLQQQEEEAAARASGGGGAAAGGGGAGITAGGGASHHHHHHLSDGDLERSAHGGAVALGVASGGASQRKVTTTAGAGGAGALGLARKGSGAGDLSSPLVGGGGLPGGAAELGLEGSGHGGELGGVGHAHAAHALSESQRLKAGRMMRLGLLMAVTMTIHNLPEGFAVAFSAFTDFGPVMALAIALHNIPEGVIIAAPIYAATGSRWKAVGLATASGLSEPLGALLSLLLLQPFFTQERLHYLLAFTGGVMLAVCGIELWPEGRNCRHDRAFAGGILGGIAVMGWTLYVEG